MLIVLYMENLSNNLWCTGTLKESWENIYSDCGMIVIIDNGNDTAFSWLLRNLLILLSYHAPSTAPVNIRVIALRNPMLHSTADINELISNDCSRMMQLPVTSQQYPFAPGAHASLPESAINHIKGYESNERGKFNVHYICNSIY